VNIWPLANIYAGSPFAVPVFSLSDEAMLLLAQILTAPQTGRQAEQ
jgi:hypothetical protein